MPAEHCESPVLLFQQTQAIERSAGIVAHTAFSILRGHDLARLPPQLLSLIASKERAVLGPRFVFSASCDVPE